MAGLPKNSPPASIPPIEAAKTDQANFSLSDLMGGEEWTEDHPPSSTATALQPPLPPPDLTTEEKATIIDRIRRATQGTAAGMPRAVMRRALALACEPQLLFPSPQLLLQSLPNQREALTALVTTAIQRAHASLLLMQSIEQKGKVVRKLVSKEDAFKGMTQSQIRDYLTKKTPGSAAKRSHPTAPDASTPSQPTKKSPRAAKQKTAALKVQKTAQTNQPAASTPGNANLKAHDGPPVARSTMPPPEPESTHADVSQTSLGATPANAAEQSPHRDLHSREPNKSTLRQDAASFEAGLERHINRMTEKAQDKANTHPQQQDETNIPRGVMEQFLAASDSDNAANMPAGKHITTHDEHPHTEGTSPSKPQSAMKQFIAETDNDNAANMQRTRPQIAFKLTLAPHSKASDKASDSPNRQQPPIAQDKNAAPATEKEKSTAKAQSTKQKSSSKSATTTAKHRSPPAHGKRKQQLTPRPQSSRTPLHIPPKNLPTPTSTHTKERCKNITTHQTIIRNEIH